MRYNRRGEQLYRLDSVAEYKNDVTAEPTYIHIVAITKNEKR